MKKLKRKKLEIPATVSNRPVTNRGVHLQPFGYHGFWLDREVQDGYWTKLLKSMGISWVVMLTEGDSVLELRHGTTPLKALLDAGIIPIIRDKQELPDGFINMETVRRTVELCAEYGLRPFWQLYNEPFDSREWKDGDVPAYNQAWQIIAGRWVEGARQIVGAGAYVGFPDGPCYAENPFERLRAAGGLDLFETGMAFYAPHNYGLGRPLWYPYDAVTRHAAKLTEEAYRRLLDDYAQDPSWYDAPIELINEQRQEWADPTRTPKTDDTCWRGWEKIVMWAMDSLGFVPPMAMTEGGWTPRARAGTAPVDNRWSYATPKMVAKKTLQMYDTPSPLFAICPWLLATTDMGGTGWFDDAWHGGAFSDKYGREKPVIAALQKTPAKEIQPRTEPMVVDLDGDSRDWAWVRQAHGASYRRGITHLPAEASAGPGEKPANVVRLIEVHEYEGPATLDVVVVDSDGLPLEGVEFYYFHPDAPAIEGHSPTEAPAEPGEEPVEAEWYDRAVLKATGADGRISFPAMGDPCAPGTCQGALWPRGKGDVLEKIGLLADSRNCHLNGVWQLVEDGIPTTEKPSTRPETGPSTGPESGPEAPAGWQMAVEYKPGPRIIAGSFPRDGIQVTVTDPWGNTTTTTSGSKPEHGPGGFEVVAPHPVTYTLSFLDQTFEVPMRDGTTIVTFVEGPTTGPETGPEAPAGWQMTVEYKPGPRIIAGSFPRDGIQVTVTDPWGNTTTTTSGSKPEHGSGGFEVVAPHPVTYTLSFLDQTFEVPMRNGTTIVTFVGGPTTGPETGPGTGPETGPESQVKSNKLGFYCEVSTTPGLVDAIRGVQPPTLLTHADDRGLLQAIRRGLSPDTFVIGRLHVDPDVQDAWLTSSDPGGKGRAFAERILNLNMGMALERHDGRLLVNAWMSLNESLPGPASDAYRKGTPAEREAIRNKADAYDRFQVAFRNRLREADSELEAVAFNFGAGNFPDATGYLDWFPRTLASYVYLGFHEYGWPALSKHLRGDASSSAGMYRTVMQGIRERYGQQHKVIMTEAGLARMYKHPRSPAGDVGWLYPGETISQQDYWRSLEWYNSLLDADDFVLGACLFEVAHGGKWVTFRHLGVDNEGHPLQIIPWIKRLRQRTLGLPLDIAPPTGAPILRREAKVFVTLRGRVVHEGQPVGGAMIRLLGPDATLGADPRAAAYNPGAVKWTMALSGFTGSVWNCWQRFVVRTVGGITWQEFKAQVAAYNPSLRETGGRFKAGQTYFLPENEASADRGGTGPEIVWDVQVEGFSGNRWTCWMKYVRMKVAGLSWEAFKEEVATRNPHLAEDGHRFMADKSYVLPRNADQELYSRVSLANARGRYGFRKLPAGSYELEVTAEGYQPLRRTVDLNTDTTLDLEI